MVQPLGRGLVSSAVDSYDFLGIERPRSATTRTKWKSHAAGASRLAEDPGPDFAHVMRMRASSPSCMHGRHGGGPAFARSCVRHPIAAARLVSPFPLSSGPLGIKERSAVQPLEIAQTTRTDTPISKQSDAAARLAASYLHLPRYLMNEAFSAAAAPETLSFSLHHLLVLILLDRPVARCATMQYVSSPLVG